MDNEPKARRKALSLCFAQKLNISSWSSKVVVDFSNNFLFLCGYFEYKKLIKRENTGYDSDMSAFQPSQRQLIIDLEQKGVLSSSAIKGAMNKVDRKKFIPGEMKEYAYSDEALPIANGQTISQPTTVIYMLELLGAKSGHKVLDVGSGTGWVSCLLSEIVGEDGKVFAFEINQEMGKIGLRNIEKHKCENIMFRITDASKYWDAYARYDRIHVAAAFEKIPLELLDQLKIGGVLVAPTQDGSLWRVVRKKENEFERDVYQGFAFVPFIEQ
ncbi:MAG: protein-L-isoaspartate O-methyltransferase [Patescibacteria group bacterium]|nr:protein-L-isoaspartate O-methyltransferase [Patescibacteria group bacterium]